MADLGGHIGDLEACHEADEIVCVRADIAHDERWPAPHGVVAPGERAVSVRISLAGPAALDVLDLDQLDHSEQAIGHHRFRLADHRVAGVVVREAEDETRVLDGGEHVDGLGEGVGDRLVADHVEAVTECRDRVRVMAVVRRHDRDDVGAVGAGGLGIEQRVRRRVCTVGCDSECCCRGHGTLGI